MGFFSTRGRREIIRLDVGEAETEAFWTEFLRSLVARGRVGVQLAISDAHSGLFTARDGIEAAGAGATPSRNCRRGCRSLATLLEGAEDDVLAFYAFPAEHWPSCGSRNPLERFNGDALL